MPAVRDGIARGGIRAGARGGSRTPDTGLRTPLLYPLSYAGRRLRLILAHAGQGIYLTDRVWEGTARTPLFHYVDAFSENFITNT